jgi:hypothetical protein
MDLLEQEKPVSLGMCFDTVLVIFPIYLLIRGLCNHMGINPHVINGSELLNRYIGDSEDAIRQLFDPAIADQIKVSIIFN